MAQAGSAALAHLTTDGSYLVGVDSRGGCYLWQLGDAACIAAFQWASPSLPPLPCLHAAWSTRGKRISRPHDACSLVIFETSSAQLHHCTLRYTQQPLDLDGPADAVPPSPQPARQPGLDSQSLGGFHTQLNADTPTSQLSDGSPSQHWRPVPY